MKIILLRGLSRQADHWGDFPHKLGAVVSAEKIITLDLPGFGSQSHNSFPSTLDEVIENLNGQLNQHVCSPPFAIIGLSLGGMIALHWVSKHPEKFFCVTVINSSLAKLSPFYRRIRPLGLVYLLGALSALTVNKRENLILSITSNQSWKDHSPLDRWISIDKKSPLRLMQVYRQLKFSASMTPPVSLKIPLLVLGSKTDKLVDVRCSEDIARFFNAKLFLNFKGGHDLALDDPHWVIHQVAEFLKTLR